MATTVTHALVPGAIDFEGVLTNTLDQVASFVPKLLVFLVVLFIGWIVAKVVAKALGIVLERIGFPTLLAKAGADDALARASINPVGLIPSSPTTSSC